MNIKSMLMRLESAVACTDLIEQMILIPEPDSRAYKEYSSHQSINLVVGYNASHRSQSALDLTMCIAHQTCLATKKQVTVQFVYVIEEQSICQDLDISQSINQSSRQSLKNSGTRNSATSVLTKPKIQQLEISSRKTSRSSSPAQATAIQYETIEQADRILKQAQCLAEEWRCNFKAHLRFGDIAKELKSVVESELATALFLGCNSVNHPLVQKCGVNLPCSVLGIPNELS